MSFYATNKIFFISRDKEKKNGKLFEEKINIQGKVNLPLLIKLVNNGIVRE